MARPAAAGLIGLLLALFALRTAAIDQLADIAPGAAARLWPGHPAVEINAGLTAIASATARRQPVAPDLLAGIFDASRKSPLSPEPFLVRGIEAQLDRDDSLARSAFLAAELRDGRSVPARYFLAQSYFQSGQPDRGLAEMAVLARLVPAGLQSLVPYLADYAGNRASWPGLRSLFASDPALEDAVLGRLAQDPAKVDIVLALAGPRGAQPPGWSTTLIGTLVSAGDFARAYRIWAAVSHLPPKPTSLVFDPQFNGSPAPPPFNWSLTSSRVGLAERRPGGALHVIFYGQEDGTLASQLLLLPPGTYRLAMQVTGDAAHARSLSWTVTCPKASQPIASLPLDPAAAARGATFTVPAGCAAQNLQLVGRSSDFPEQADVTVSRLSLTRAG
jgi:hypothetical protein